MELLESAWGVIANAGWDDFAKTAGWQEAAERWRDDYHRWLDLHLRPGGYHTWEQLADSLVRERDALFSEVAGLRLERARAGSAALIAADLDLETPAASWRERAEAAEGSWPRSPSSSARSSPTTATAPRPRWRRRGIWPRQSSQVIDRDKSSSEEEGRGHSTRLPGHGLRAEEARGDDGRGGTRRADVYGEPDGFGLCSCGGRSGVLGSDADRRRWHKAHKDEIRTEGDEGNVR